MARIIWSPKSLRQIEEIAAYIAFDSETQAKRVVERILSAPARLEIFPESGSIVSEVKKRLIREIRIFNYRIMYRLLEENTLVEIVGVIHGARLLTEDLLEP